MGARVIGLGVPMGWEGCPRPSNGRPHHVEGHSLSLDRCPPLPEGCSRSTDGTILHGRSVTPSREGTHPYGMMGVSIRQDRRLRPRKGCIPPGEADTRTGRRTQPSGMKDVPIPRSRTPIGPHAHGQADTRMCPLAQRPVAMRPDGHQQAGIRKYPFASCGPPWALMVPRKRRDGCIARGKGLRPSGRIDSSERGEGAPLPGSREPMRPHRRADEPEGSSDRRRGPLPSVSSIPSSTPSVRGMTRTSPGTIGGQCR